MSQENVEIVRRCFDLLNRERLAALDEIEVVCDPDVEIRRGAGRLPDVTLLRGRDAVRRSFAEILGTLDTRFELAELIDADDSVVAVFRQIASGRTSGVELDNPFACIYGFRKGMITYLDIYLTKDEALEAVGLRE